MPDFKKLVVTYEAEEGFQPPAVYRLAKIESPSDDDDGARYVPDWTNYRELLKRYMDLVFTVEGFSLLDSGMSTIEDFTPDQVEAIRAIEAELKAEYAKGTNPDTAPRP